MMLRRRLVRFDKVLDFAERVIPDDIVDETRKGKPERVPRGPFEGVSRPWEAESDIGGEKGDSLADLLEIEDQDSPFGKSVSDTIHQTPPFENALHDHAER